MPPPVNPYAKPRSFRPQNDKNMGPQSQRRLTLTERTNQLKSNNNNKRKGGQLTLTGDAAFDPVKDCEICKARHIGYAEPHRGHHRLCWNNKRTKGITSATTLASNKETNRLKVLFSQPVQPHEVFTSRNNSKEVAQRFFEPRRIMEVTTTTTVESTESTTVMDVVPVPRPEEFCDHVMTKVQDGSFMLEHSKKEAPLAVLAVAGFVVERILRNKDSVAYNQHFEQCTFTVPVSVNMCDNPQHHSIVGHKLLLVDWKKIHGYELPCAVPNCIGTLKNDRTNFSKNKALFPIYAIDGAPMWCMVMSMVCSCCKRRINANDSEMLCRLPAHVAAAYPVHSKYALGNKNSHIEKGTTNVFDQVMTTYANGDLCSRLLYSAVNNAYLERVSSYYSYFKEKKQQHGSVAPKPYVQKDGVFIKTFPPTGETIRELFDDSFNNTNTAWGISDHDRHTREIQSVSCEFTMAQDHTFDVLHNYHQKKVLGAAALWDVATETGEIATAVLVPSTKTIHFAHAARQLAGRECFNPKVMYSDTYPNKSDFWPLLFDNIEGRLGLFHYIQRITRTLQKKHVDYFEAITLLLDAVYSYHSEDFEGVISALKKGHLGRKPHSDQDIAELRGTRYFRQRYGKYIRKIIRPAHTMVQLLDDWFVRFKVTASEGSRPARGRLDPRMQMPLFKSETKLAVEECKKKAQHLADPLPINEMYMTVPANPNSQHQLPQYLSRRAESKLESFHDNLSHFSNCGMRRSLCDNLNLCGTARYNLAIRHKIRLTRKNTEQEAASRKHIPSAWEDIVPYPNHSELHYINTLAREAGVDQMPFADVEPLPADNGERFFSEYIVDINPSKQQYDSLDRCLCNLCRGIMPTKIPPQQNNQQASAQCHGTMTTNTSDITTMTTTPRTPAKQNSEHKSLKTTNSNQLSTRPSNKPAAFKQTLLQPRRPHTEYHHHHHDFQNASVNYFAAPPIPMMMPFGFPYPWFVAGHPTMTHSAAPSCCSRHSEWSMTPHRVGRPPHDAHCQVRRFGKRQGKKKNTETA